ncbi:MAG: lipid A export permease/ATP-binding protein MsbA [Gammaproteobacteria bacterium]|nr:lipid A export permease/ATP-binding protein MsbA [Gammaproteobacteria bacterium]
MSEKNVQTENPEMTAGDIYGRLLRISLKQWPIFLASIIAMAVFAASDTGFAFLIKTLTEIIEAGDELTKQQQFIKDFLPLGVLLLFLARGIAGFLSGYGLAVVSMKVVGTLRQQLFDKFLVLPTAYYDKNSSAKLLAKMNYDLGQLAGAASGLVIVVVRDVLTVVGLVSYMFYLNYKLAGFVFVTAPIIALIVRFLGGVFRRHSTKIQGAVGEFTRVLQESLQAARIIKLFNTQRFESERFAKVSQNELKLGLRLAAVSGMGNAATVFITAMGLAGVIYLVTKITPGVSEVGGFIAAIVLLMAPLKRVTGINATIQRSIAGGESVFGMLDAEAELDTGRHAPDSVRGEVSFKNVSFSYSGEQDLVLKNIDLAVPQGQRIAIVGRSGGGKTTLVNLIPRFYNPTEGQILIDGVSSADYTLHSLRSFISVVSQEVTLFNQTIAENIAYGAGDVTLADIEKAASAAHVDEFTKDMPEGINTMVGDRGVMLSGGQRQRVSIARALLKNSPILILDEATSALDTQSERHIQTALHELMQSRTTFVIAHRLSTIENADRIIVMSAGQVIESGSHSELMAVDGAYAALHNMQFQEAEAQ